MNRDDEFNDDDDDDDDYDLSLDANDGLPLA